MYLDRKFGLNLLLSGLAIG